MAVIYMPQDTRWQNVAQGAGQIIGSILGGYLQEKQYKNTMTQLQTAIKQYPDDPMKWSQVAGSNPDAQKWVSDYIKMYSASQEAAERKQRTAKLKEETEELTTLFPTKQATQQAELVKKMTEAKYAEGEARSLISERQAQAGLASARTGLVPLQAARIQSEMQTDALRREALKGQITTADEQKVIGPAVASGAVDPNDASKYRGQKAKWDQMALDVDPGYKSSRYATIRAFTDGKSQPSKTVTAISNATSHLVTLGRLYDAINNKSGVPAIQAIYNKWKTATGAPDFTSVEAAVNIVGNEVVKSVVNSGGTAEDRKEARDSLIKASTTPAQAQGNLATVGSILRTQMDHQEHLYNVGTGLDDPNVNPQIAGRLNFKGKILPSETAAILDRFPASPEAEPGVPIFGEGRDKALKEKGGDKATKPTEFKTEKDATDAVNRGDITLDQYRDALLKLGGTPLPTKPAGQ